MPNVITLIKKHEGSSGRPYCDRCGYRIGRGSDGWSCLCPDRGLLPGCLTIGVGHNLDDAPLDQLAVDSILAADYAAVESDLMTFAWYASLSDARKAALADMRFNLGPRRFREFRNMLDALAHGNFSAAADAILDSEWAGQVIARAADDANLMRTGTWPAD